MQICKAQHESDSSTRSSVFLSCHIIGTDAIADVSSQSGCMCRQSAFNLAIAGWLPCGALLALVAVSLTKDEAAMQARLAHKVDNHIPHVDDSLPYTNSNT